MRRKFTHIRPLVLAAVTIAALCTRCTGLPVHAAETEITAQNTGDYLVTNGYVSFGQGSASITISGNSGQPLSGKRFEIFRLFDAENSVSQESVNYTFCAKYQAALKAVAARALNKRDGKNLTAAQITEYMVIDYIQSLNSSPSEGAQVSQTPEGRYSAFRYFVEDVRTEIKNSGISGDFVYVQSTLSDNTLSINGLPYGYYLVDEVSSQDSEGGDWFASSLCMVNTANPEASIHIKSDYPEIIKKIQEDDSQSAVGNAGWNDIADYEIGQTVPYKYESTISDMNGYQSYYYAWHDQMDEALSFRADKRTTKIVITQKGQTYTVKDTEYNIVTTASELEERDTFLIEIPDIKKIADREFNHKDTAGHNDYSGMRVTLTYEAVLNEKAADKTGRPGFENHVRLEFSNDADSDGSGKTGYTPWDTVICFTFKLEGLKTNNHGLPLEDAVFRLYSDPECKNEVYVKSKTGSASDRGYLVINRDSVGGNDHTDGTKPVDAAEIRSGKDGIFTIYGLDAGTYYLKETDAPDGYRLLLDPVVLTVKPSYTADRNNYIAGEGATEETLQKLEVTAHMKAFYDEVYHEDKVNLDTDMEDGSASIQIINETGSRLPVTGSYTMLLLIGGGSILMLTALTAGRKKNRNQGRM